MTQESWWGEGLSKSGRRDKEEIRTAAGSLPPHRNVVVNSREMGRWVEGCGVQRGFFLKKRGFTAPYIGELWASSRFLYAHL